MIMAPIDAQGHLSPLPVAMIMEIRSDKSSLSHFFTSGQKVVLIMDTLGT